MTKFNIDVTNSEKKSETYNHQYTIKLKQKKPDKSLSTQYKIYKKKKKDT